MPTAIYNNIFSKHGMAARSRFVFFTFIFCCVAKKLPGETADYDTVSQHQRHVKNPHNVRLLENSVHHVDTVLFCQELEALL